MVLSSIRSDLGESIIAAGGATAYLTNQIRDTEALRGIRAISATCDAQRTSAIRSGNSVKADASLQSAAEAALSDARDRLEEIRERATVALFEHEERKRKLEALFKRFDDLKHASHEYLAVAKCREIADAYVCALRPLALHQRDGSLADMDTVATNIETLIEKVDSVRRKGSKCLFGDDLLTNQRIIASIENRAVDAIVKARAAFVNVLDNEFREFGWPMKVPIPENDITVIDSVNFYVRQLSQLQQVASKGDYVPERTRWHKALSDSWAIAAILRAPLARFKYHFLESFRSGAEGDGAIMSETEITSGTSRVDRPEWAAEFALDRIREATPFLSKVAIDGPRTADVKFAEGFCRVFAGKIAYDCELALRTSTNDSDADELIAHASETAKQFDAKLRSGVIHVDNYDPVSRESPIFFSSLHVLSLNEWFLTTWASSELRLAETEVNKLLVRVLNRPTSIGGGVISSKDSGVVSRSDLELLCQEIVNFVGGASQKCRSLESDERISTFLKLTEVPLLKLIRSALKEEIQISDPDVLTADEVARAGRASFCAQLLADALEDRSCEAFYVQREKSFGFGFYEDEISRLQSVYTTTSALLCDGIARVFCEGVRGGYMDQAHFGEIVAPDAAVVLTHDLSDSLVGPLTALENYLIALASAVPCRKSASRVWKPIAERLDCFFFDEVVLQCFAGGSRNAMAAASASNSYLSPESSARMARQLAFDTGMFVSTFCVVTAKPRHYIRCCGECDSILRIGSSMVLLPSVPKTQVQEEVVSVLKLVAETGDEAAIETARDALMSRLGIHYIAPREALELLAICGLKLAIPFM